MNHICPCSGSKQQPRNAVSRLTAPSLNTELNQKARRTVYGSINASYDTGKVITMSCFC